VTLKGKYGARSKIVINEEIIDRILNIKYLGCEILLLKGAGIA
jgi:hypothetical protein